MATDLVTTTGNEIVCPGTGELVSLDDAPAVARALRALREFKRDVEDARSVLEAALIGESERQGTKTLHLDGLTASISADTAVEWDVTVLLRLLEAGLPAERYAALVTEEVSYKVDGRVAAQIAGANERYAEIVAAAKNRVPKRPYVRVEAS